MVCIVNTVTTWTLTCQFFCEFFFYPFLKCISLWNVRNRSDVSNSRVFELCQKHWTRTWTRKANAAHPSWNNNNHKMIRLYFANVCQLLNIKAKFITVRFALNSWSVRLTYSKCGRKNKTSTRRGLDVLKVQFDVLQKSLFYTGKSGQPICISGAILQRFLSEF